ncbi:hypothetical protein HMPREF0971_01908 [Segatella oris F0302]|uniref:Uncharacterized protein n=1 Tax=Segatella oris F0302 TaxID=649760 RepID=D1QSE9_9BACT|nr:hypothetical protein HMPREF0971_01908 [Segatella oris F0302]
MVCSASNGKVISVFLQGEMTEIERQGDINEDTEAMKWLCTCIEKASHKPRIWLLISIPGRCRNVKNGKSILHEKRKGKAHV